MAYNRLPNDLPERLRKYGLKVVEVDGWQTRGRPASTGEFHPVGVLCHHTASPKTVSDKTEVNLLIQGRKDLIGPLVQFGLARDGTIYLVASGRCNHAGSAKASGTVAAGDGNALYIGIEGFNNGSDEAWPQVQYDAYVLLCAALSVEVTKNSAQTVRGHKETSKTGKPDPRFDMDVFRKKVASKMEELKKGTGTVTTQETTTAFQKMMKDVAAKTPGDKPSTTYIKGTDLSLWLKYGGKAKGAFSLLKEDGWKELDCNFVDAPPIAGKEDHYLYTRLYFVWDDKVNTGDVKVEAYFERSDGDITAMDEQHFEHGTNSVPFSVFHTETGSKLSGKWFMKVHGGGAKVVIGTRYCKTHAIGK